MFLEEGKRMGICVIRFNYSLWFCYVWTKSPGQLTKQSLRETRCKSALEKNDLIREIFWGGWFKNG